MTERERTEQAVWIGAYERTGAGPACAKEWADAALAAYREAFPNEPQAHYEALCQAWIKCAPAERARFLFLQNTPQAG